MNYLNLDVLLQNRSVWRVIYKKDYDAQNVYLIWKDRFEWTIIITGLFSIILEVIFKTLTMEMPFQIKIIIIFLSLTFTILSLIIELITRKFRESAEQWRRISSWIYLCDTNFTKSEVSKLKTKKISHLDHNFEILTYVDEDLKWFTSDKYPNLSKEDKFLMDFAEGIIWTVPSVSSVAKMYFKKIVFSLILTISFFITFLLFNNNQEILEWDYTLFYFFSVFATLVIKYFIDFNKLKQNVKDLAAIEERVNHIIEQRDHKTILSEAVCLFQEYNIIQSDFLFEDKKFRDKENIAHAERRFQEKILKYFDIQKKV